MVDGTEILLFHLLQFNQELANITNSDVIILRAPMVTGLDDIVKTQIENLKKNSPDIKKISILLETGGGFIEVVQRIYSVFRHHYELVDFIIPNFAYSAGTVLALSGDEIYMDYYSVLGPIDPQVSSENNDLLPGIGYLLEYEALINKINNPKNPNSKAEMAFLLKKFDPAKLFYIKQARDHSIDLLKEWLPKHKFKDWKKHSSTGEDVTDEDRKERAEKIAGILGNPERWHSHGRGISIDELCGEEIKLKVVNFNKDANLNNAINQYYGLFIDLCGKLGSHGAIHTTLGMTRV